MKSILENLKGLLIIAALTMFCVYQYKDHRQPTPEQNVYTTANLPVFAMRQNLDAGQYLPMVGLYKDGHFFCSGTVISNDYVLTAAHCIMDHDEFHPGLMKEDINVRSIQDRDYGVFSVKAKAAALNQRADYALVRGDFSNFKKMQVTTSPLENAPDRIMIAVSCGFPWSAEPTCYVWPRPLVSVDSKYIAEQAIYPGMSGGPVISLLTNSIVAVNSASYGTGAIYAPLIGLFETLQVPVEP